MLMYYSNTSRLYIFGGSSYLQLRFISTFKIIPIHTYAHMYVCTRHYKRSKVYVCMYVGMSPYIYVCTYACVYYNNVKHFLLTDAWIAYLASCQIVGSACLS